MSSSTLRSVLVCATCLRATSCAFLSTFIAKILPVSFLRTEHKQHTAHAQRNELTHRCTHDLTAMGRVWTNLASLCPARRGSTRQGKHRQESLRIARIHCAHAFSCFCSIPVCCLSYEASLPDDFEQFEVVDAEPRVAGLERLSKGILRDRCRRRQLGQASQRLVELSDDGINSATGRR